MGIESLAKDDYAKHRRLVHQLCNAGSRKDLRLARLLWSCTDERPCRSGACIHCGRDFQVLAVELINRGMRQPARRDLRGRMSMLTIIPQAGCLGPNDLTVEICGRVGADIVFEIEKCGISCFAASLDISFDEDTTGRVDPHWCVHTHVTAADWLTSAQAGALRAAFPKSRLIAKPIRVEVLDNEEAALFYPVKPDRVRRVSYVDDSNPDRAPFRNSHRRQLRPRQAVTLAHVEHQLGHNARLVTRGIDENAVNALFNSFYRTRDPP